MKKRGRSNRQISGVFDLFPPESALALIVGFRSAGRTRSSSCTWPRRRSSRKSSRTCGLGRTAVSASISRCSCRPASRYRTITIVTASIPTCLRRTTCSQKMCCPLGIGLQLVVLDSLHTTRFQCSQVCAGQLLLTSLSDSRH